MVAGKIDIGSMGDYPLLINGSRTQEFGDGHTKLIAATGYNLLGALNMVVVPPKSPAHTLADLRGKKISTSVGSAGHGTTVHALRDAGVSTDDVHIQNQAPAVGVSGLQSGAVDALGQFVAWPGQLVFTGQARLLYDGSALGLPTWHGVVVRESYADSHRDVVDGIPSRATGCDGLPARAPDGRGAEGRRRRRACRPRSSTSTTARAAWSPSTCRSRNP